ncbi:hypothetical protein K493DRAFT_300987 [Basidiobolus meristosporus CBS 931.73]|uniref:Yeast cell wall synthesis Kre9/Knh1-like N-terminal domain-containing protein n=1 Tax=Basidiobolus meristosporus CBS 931.73 TaxID=1314790 RepID=A0A1Y1YEE1_9FUNG|nr:hypothetical protein K493DRAFT_300987 [Basidiobolus meristosporus CBS 931.73]|eukprot:ORX96338.1 hypothetical protein K493DRAFT_300987 [Basidiobolus meristosporus CBS 931.73]
MIFTNYYSILGLAIGCATAEIMITEPVEITRWQRGENAIVKWNIDAIDLAELVTIELRIGPKVNLALSYEIATEVDANEESHSWFVPENLIPGDKYSVRIITDKGVDRYSHYFTIV